MSVTIVSPLPNLKQTVAANNTATKVDVSDSTVADQDFASLLQGQMAPVLPTTLPESTVQTDLPVADATPTDAAALLAALGFVPLEQGRTGTTQVTDAMKTLQTAVSAVQIPKGEGKTESVMTEPVLTETPAADDKPAKFAAPSLVVPNAETVKIKSALAETLPNTTSALSTNTPTNANIPSVNREVSLSVPTPVRDQGWAGDFGQKIVWLASNDKQSAQITLNPPQMGPIEISLNLEKGSASASFVSANSEVRAALESALPKLREMFASAGIELGQTNVSAESFRQQAESGDGNRSSSQWRSDNAILDADSAASLSARAFSEQRGSGLVDIFA